LRYLRRAIAAGIALLFLVLSSPTVAQTITDVVGTWHGSIETPQGRIILVLYVTKDVEGGLRAEAETPNQMPGQRIEASDLNVENGRLTFSIASSHASYDGIWDAAEQEWEGTFTQGIEMPLDLVRGLPAPTPVVAGLDGKWEGALESNGAILRLALNVNSSSKGTVVTLDSPDQLAAGLPITGLTREGRVIKFDFLPGKQHFEGTLSGDDNVLEGAWSSSLTEPKPIRFERKNLASVSKPLARPQHPVEPFPYRVQEVDFANLIQPSVRLSGTLTLPTGNGPFPAAILISGSGPQDRDETVVGHRPFAVLADHLTRNGIAVLRYDDRGVGKSTGQYNEATTADLATDANAAASFLLTRSDIRRDAVGFIGHSEGGVIGPIAMSENDDIAYIVLLAAPGTGLERLLLSQRRLVGQQMGMSRESIDKAEPILAAIFQAIKDAKTYEDGIEAALALLTPEALVAIGGSTQVNRDHVMRQFSSRWLRYLLRYDPAPNLAKIGVPVLALSGSLDVQVPSRENLAAIAAALINNSDVTTTELTGLNHLFQTSKTGAVGEYRDIEETFSPVALNIISSWITQRFIDQREEHTTALKR
jgi:hypothetical protein